jgi:hypothetical protein
MLVAPTAVAAVILLVVLPLAQVIQILEVLTALRQIVLPSIGCGKDTASPAAYIC